MSPLDEVIQHFSRLPGIGDRTATRLAFHLLRAHPQFREGLAQSLQRLSEIHFCKECSTVTERPLCAICSSPVRHLKSLCVVEKPSDIYSLEKLNRFHGRYHVLHGLLSPLEGIGPQDLKISALLERLQRSPLPDELILALSPTIEGDATAQYIVKQLQNYPLTVTRLASGLAVGTSLEFADQISLGKAFEARLVLR